MKFMFAVLTVLLANTAQAQSTIGTLDGPFGPEEYVITETPDGTYLDKLDGSGSAFIPNEPEECPEGSDERKRVRWAVAGYHSAGVGHYYVNEDGSVTVCYEVWATTNPFGLGKELESTIYVTTIR